MKMCGKCKQSQPPSEFHKDPSRRDGLRGTCKGCRTSRASGKSPELKTIGFMVDFGDGCRAAYVRGHVEVALRAPGSAGACHG